MRLRPCQGCNTSYSWTRIHVSMMSDFVSIVIPPNAWIRIPISMLNMNFSTDTELQIAHVLKWVAF